MHTMSRSGSPDFKSLKLLNSLTIFLFFPFHLFQQHFHDGRKAQQHIESSWKQLESVSDPINVQYHSGSLVDVSAGHSWYSDSK